MLNMIHWIRLDYLSCVLTVLATVLIGKKLWQGWVVAGINSAVVCVIGIRTAQFGSCASPFTPATSSAGAPNLAPNPTFQTRKPHRSSVPRWHFPESYRSFASLFPSLNPGPPLSASALSIDFGFPVSQRPVILKASP